MNAASMAFKKALIKRALGAELGHHLGQAHERSDGPRNHRNGVSAKTVATDEGPVRIDVPRDRQGSFELLLIADSVPHGLAQQASRSAIEGGIRATGRKPKSDGHLTELGAGAVPKRERPRAE